MENDLHMFINYSQERLKNVKFGKKLADTLKSQRAKYKDLRCRDKGLEYNSQDFLFRKNLFSVPKDLSPAMKEYYSTRKFSPVLEVKKLLNIEKFFLVKITQEKYKILNNVFHKNTLPVVDFFPAKEKDLLLELKEKKFSSPGPFKRKLSNEDREIKKIIQIEKMKELEESKKLEKFNFKALKKAKPSKIQTIPKHPKNEVTDQKAYFT